jgi:sigma-E factor negative regulatory protein RseB
MSSLLSSPARPAPARKPLGWWPRAAWLGCLLPMLSLAAPEGAPVDARIWLARIHAAAHNGNYQGTMVFSAGGTMSSSRVWHVAIGDEVFEHFEALDGRQQRIVRHNDAVHTLWPQTKLAVVEKRETLAAWSTTPQSVQPQALEQYALLREGSARVAGREALVFLLEPHDALRYAQRLWADQASNLILRADVLGLAPAANAARPVLESTAFSEVAIGMRPQLESAQQTLRNLGRLDGYRVVRPQQQRTSLEAEGWVLARPVPGFKLAGCVRRGMETSGEEEPVLQAVFDDGLTHVSLFIEPYRPQRHAQEVQARQGATATRMTRRGDWWITTVGDVPQETLKLFTEAVDRRRP